MTKVDQKSCIEELIKYTLTSFINGTLNSDLGLSISYCSDLLREDSAASSASSSCDFIGVPAYPLYKRLAAALYESVTSGVLFSGGKKGHLLQVDDEVKQKEIENEWSLLVSDNGSHLVNALSSVNFEMHVQEPYFSYLRDGLKVVEGRCACGDYNRIGPGYNLLLNQCVMLEVLDVQRYDSFSEMLVYEGLSRVLPGVGTIEEGVQVYRRFYTEMEEKSFGVLAIQVQKPANQPFDFVSTILSVNNSTLSVGARAVAKHANRDSSHYWGASNGNDSNKNQQALDLISKMLCHCCWLNIHITPPHGEVFEIRVADGYGARWTKDGTQFIGFLEPYMEDGHIKGWRH